MSDNRPGDPNVVHVLLPNMRYACWETILTTAGRFEVGAHNWDAITCPGCRQHGRDYLIALSMWMQGHGPHPDEMPAPLHHEVLIGEQMGLFEGAA